MAWAGGGKVEVNKGVEAQIHFEVGAAFFGICLFLAVFLVGILAAAYNLAVIYLTK